MQTERGCNWSETKNKFRTIWGYKTNTYTKSEAEIGKKIRTSLEHFGAKKK